MLIDWNHFTPWTSLTGGILLGLASTLFILVNGRILVEDGEPRHLDPALIVEQHNRAARNLLVRAGVA